MHLCATLVGMSIIMLTANCLYGDPPINDHTKKLQELLKERRKTLGEELVLTVAREEMYPDKSQWALRVCDIRERLLDVDLALSKSDPERLSVYEKAIEEFKKIEASFKDRSVRGLFMPQDEVRVKDYRLKIEINMTKEQIKHNANK
jgi:hypothetical protein